MKISIHSDVLVEMALAEDPAISAILANPALELWSPTLCVAAAYRQLSADRGSEAARALLQVVERNLSTVPLRMETVVRGTENGLDDLEMASHLEVDSLVGISGVLTRQAEGKVVGGLHCISPEQLATADTTADNSAPVPFLDLKAQFPKVFNEIDNRFVQILSTTGFILGPHVEEFERNFAELQGSRYCVGLSTGTDALHVAFEALGIGRGDEVLVPVNTFIATAEGVSLAGATPVFVDSNELYNIDVQKAREILEARQGKGNIRAIVPVHLYGQPADLGALRALADEFDLAIVEDCAQAHLAEYRGQPVGNIGEFGTFSFYPGKNLGAFGEAGAVVTNDEKLYERVRMYRAHGEAKRYVHSIEGHNYRMEALQGAVLATKAKYIAEWTDARRHNASLYKQYLTSIEEVVVPEEAEFAKSVYHLFVVQVPDRDRLRAFLEDGGIASGLHYPVPLHLQKAYHASGYNEGDFPVAERQAGRILSLPMYPELSERQIKRVCERIGLFFSGKGAQK